MRKICFSLLAILALLTPWGAIAQEATQTAQPAQNPQNEATQDAINELEQVSQALELTQERADFLRQEIEAMSGDRAAQNAALIAAAQRVKLAEEEASETEIKLVALIDRERAIRTRLEAADGEIASLLAGLQRIAQNPPPALIIDPTDAINAARTASLLSAVLPQMRDRAEQVSADLRTLVILRESVEEEKEIFAARLITLQEEQLRIATLIEARRVGVDRASNELEIEEETAAELAAEATSLDQLITALREKIEAVDNAIATAESLGATVPESTLTAEAVQAALSDTEREVPAFAITNARGHLTSPAAGVVVTQFGTDDGFGGISKGVSVVTRSEAQVVTPADAWVIYKGPYLNYGEIIILNAGEEHVILLAGLAEVNVELGEFVRMGEPVGSMGARTIGQTVATSAGIARPTLYIEFRNNNVPFDPVPLWSSGEVAQISQ